MSGKKGGRANLPGSLVHCKHCLGKGLVSIVSGDVLRAHRESLGWTLRGFAGYLGFTPAYVSDIELGKRRATEAIIDAYEIAPVAP